MAEVSWICKRTVVSTKPVEAGKFCPLSVLDRIMEHNHVRVVLYYRCPKERKAGESTRMLRESLAELLSAYPIVTGRLLKTAEGHWMIKCNDAGVRMVEARAKGSVDKWLQNFDREKELNLVHWEPMFHKLYFWSTFYVQLTEFEEGGLAVGLSCGHLLSDPICVTIFIKAWADMTLNGKMVTPPLFHRLPRRGQCNETTNPQPFPELINYYKSTLEKPVPVVQAKQTTIKLAFGDEMVRSCIAMSHAPGSPDEPSPTPFQALAGLFWVGISKIKGLRNGLISMSICLDMRKVLGLDKGFFGNCMVYNQVPGDGIEEYELSKAANAIREVVDTMDAEGIMNLIEWMEGKADQFSCLMNGYDLICVNLEHVDSYSAIFEENFKPIHASYYIEPTVGEGMILVLPSPPGEGSFSRVVMITLPEDEAINLLEDKLIQQFSPTILMMADKKHTTANSDP
ncbi:protein ECERIFERUM 26-like [Coffea eugenioides]|uniref:protein ECERIFERUM 26-like n=1 Tax=Coffea eugenioides TaxID=49369 RepID=UPI000F606EC4|nr:protein ECERIFERUM 26-like [Coffea eugenioides]